MLYVVAVLQYQWIYDNYLSIFISVDSQALWKLYQVIQKKTWVQLIITLSQRNTTKGKLCTELLIYTVYPKKYAHGFVVLCFVVVMQSFIMNSHEVFIHIHQGCFAGTGAIVRLPQCQWSKPDGYGKICQCVTTTKHSKAKTVCILLGIYCIVCKTYYETSR